VAAQRSAVAVEGSSEVARRTQCANDDEGDAVNPTISESDRHLRALDATEGEFRSFMRPRGLALKHEAGPLLLRYATHGCPAKCGRPWTLEELGAAVEKGPHLSAREPGAAEQFRKEAREKEAQGFCRILKWKTLRRDPPRDLKISPLAAVPHKSRSWRAILDLSFELEVNGKRLASVNDASEATAPAAALDQMGEALPRLIAAVAAAPGEGGNIVFAKLDIKDGFWRMSVQRGAEWNFAYVLPPAPGQEPRDVDLVVPSAVQMGWTESPGFFCAASETARDVADDRCAEPVGSLPPHPLEDWMLPPDKWASQERGSTPGGFVNMLEVYVDDFCAMAQSTNAAELRHVSRALLHSAHNVFPLPEISGLGGEDSISLKKLKEGEGEWETRKELLGWIFDGRTRCIELPLTKIEKIGEQINQAVSAWSMRRCDYEKLLGRVRHAALGVPGSAGLFTPLNMALRDKSRWVRINGDVREALVDFRLLLHTAAAEPTHVNELVPGPPAVVGYCDACRMGAGGVWLSGTKHLEPIVWRVEWPDDIKAALITRDNPNGTISVSDLEMAGLLLQYLVLEWLKALRHEHVGAFCDNTPTVSWAAKLASKRSRIAGRLLRALAIRQRVQRSSPLITVSIAGKDNNMADASSRSFGGEGTAWAEAGLTDDAFLLRFNRAFPLPQNNSWRGFQLSSAIVSRVISVLRGERSTLGSWIRLPQSEGSIGAIGASMRVTWESAPSFTRKRSHGTSASGPSQVLLAGSGRATMATNVLSEFKRFKSRYEPSARRARWSEGTILP